ncbi:MAG: SHOCT domain-containing protein [Prevotellaceae bacterium]|jgi:hypothetical protein|nr:SHOCT domain-containing protein [Prevotellaceae bacterium]
MKKLFITLIATIISAGMSTAQSDDFAELRDKTLYLKNGTILREGDVLYIGNPTGCYENCYENIFHEPAEMLTKLTNKFTQKVYARYSGEKVSVKKIKQITKDAEKIWLVTLHYLPKKENLYCYLETALNAGEIVVNKNGDAINKADVKPEIKQIEQVEQPKQIQPQEKTATNFSVADEIRKLKALLDEGIITKEEFEKQKAKLLE